VRENWSQEVKGPESHWDPQYRLRKDVRGCGCHDLAAVDLARGRVALRTDGNSAAGRAGAF
jgi:hypothetical protein